MEKNKTKVDEPKDGWFMRFTSEKGNLPKAWGISNPKLGQVYGLEVAQVEGKKSVSFKLVLLK